MLSESKCSSKFFEQLLKQHVANCTMLDRKQPDQAGSSHGRRPHRTP